MTIMLSNSDTPAILELQEKVREYHVNQIEIRNDLTRTRMYIDSGDPKDLEYLKGPNSGQAR